MVARNVLAFDNRFRLPLALLLLLLLLAPLVGWFGFDVVDGIRDHALLYPKIYRRAVCILFRLVHARGVCIVSRPVAVCSRIHRPSSNSDTVRYQLPTASLETARWGL